MYHVPCTTMYHHTHHVLGTPLFTTMYHHTPPCHQSQVQVDLTRPCAPLIDSVYAGLIRLDGHIVVTSGFSSVAICIRKNICLIFFFAHPPLHPYHGGHDRDVNNAINQGGDSWSFGSDKWKRQKKRNQTEGNFRNLT